MKEKLLEVIENFRGRRIGVLGDCMLDEFVFGRVERISPEAPVPVVLVERKEYRPGGAANVWRNLKDLGAEALLFSVIGKDREGEILASMMDSSTLVEDPDRPTTVKTRIIAQNQQVVRVDRETTLPLNDKLAERLARLVAESDIEGLIISDYEKGAITPLLLSKLLPALREKGVPVFVDPKIKNFRLYRKVFMIKPNLKETSALVGKKLNDLEEIKEAGLKLMEWVEPEIMCITMGAKGMMLFSDDKISHIPSRALEVFDVTGAGDTVIAVFALSSLSGASPEEAAELANFAASVVIRKVGTSSLLPQELISAVKDM